jgi:hypothetical protein
VYDALVPGVLPLVVIGGVVEVQAARRGVLGHLQLRVLPAKVELLVVEEVGHRTVLYKLKDCDERDEERSDEQKVVS